VAYTGTKRWGCYLLLLFFLLLLFCSPPSVCRYVLDGDSKSEIYNVDWEDKGGAQFTKRERERKERGRERGGICALRHLLLVGWRGVCWLSVWTVVCLLLMHVVWCVMLLLLLCLLIFLRDREAAHLKCWKQQWGSVLCYVQQREQGHSEGQQPPSDATSKEQQPAGGNNSKKDNNHNIQQHTTKNKHRTN